MSQWVNLFQAELQRQWRLVRAYPLNEIARLVLFTLVFFLITGLSNLIANGNFAERAQQTFLLGYLIWRIGTGFLEDLVNTVAEDAKWGVLEQITISGHSLLQVLSARICVLVLYYSLRAVVMLFIILPLLNISLPIRPIAIIPYLITLLGMAGLGLGFVGLHLIYKSINFLIEAITFTLFFLTGILTSFDALPTLFTISRLLPLSAGVDLLRQTAFTSIDLPQLLQTSTFWSMTLNTLVYLATGIYLFHYGLQRAQQDGSLAHY